MQKDQGLMLSWGVLFAGACQMLLLAWANNKNGLSFGISFPTFDESVKKFIKRFVPSALGAGTTQINLLVSSIFASQIPGAISWLYYSDRVAQLPLGIIGVAIGTVLLPDLSKKISLELKEEGYSVQEKAILISIFFALPASVSLIYMPDLIINALFGYGVFSASDVAFTANALKVYAFGIPAFMLIKILSPLFFARQDIKTPVLIAGFSTILNIFLTWFLIKKMGFVGIAVSLVITGWINAVILFLIILIKKFYVLNRRFFYVVSIIIISTFFMLISLSILNHVFITFNQSLTNFPEVLKLFIMIVIGLLSYLGMSYMFKLFRYLK
jgi:putative peptidoglycan lipid II flippase